MEQFKNIRAKNSYKISMHIIKIVIIFLLFVGIYSCLFRQSSESNDSMAVSYIEDVTGTMNLEDVQKIEPDQFIKKENSELSLGRSQSKWWIRFKLKDVSNFIDKKYLLIYNPTVAEVKLYLPVENDTYLNYKLYHSGWKFADQNQDENFFYPAFSFDQVVDEDEYIYINIYSTFTQNYDIKLLTENQFTNLRDTRNMFIGVLFGIFIALILFNSIIFLELKDRAYLWYVIYLIVLVVYEADLLGVFSVYIPNTYAILMKNTISLSLIVMLISLIFVKVFFNVRTVFPKHNKYFISIYIAIAVGLVLDQVGIPTLSNLYAHNLSLLGASYIVYIGLKSVKLGYSQAKFFLAGWTLVILSLIISLMRHMGLVSNNNITVNITVIAFATQAIFLSAAIVNRMKGLIEERERSEIRIKGAEEMANLNEIMFLQAQIKPHFLYNTLNVIASLCRIDPTQARLLILDLSQYLHHTFSYKSEDYQSSLESELDYIKAYVNIEQARFKDKIQVIYDISVEHEVVIPSMSIQPLVENAIRHGIRKGLGKGKVCIRISEIDECLTVEVEDDGIGLTETQVNQINSGGQSISGGIGLCNINRRLKMLYGTALKVESTLGKGTCFSFNIPIK